MLPTLGWGERTVCGGPLVVMCHWLGGSAESWALLAERLADRGLRCVAVDLPGFGSAAEVPGYSIREMADAVIGTVQSIRQEDPAPGSPWLLAGHSMGGTVAAVVAREAASGRAGLSGLRGVVLVSPSPPGPEPMKESKRADMLATVGTASGDAATDRKRAEDFVKTNVGKPALGAATLHVAVDGVLRANKAAIRAWLESGSKEDWREFLGDLALPALVFAGSEDAALGPDVQRAETLPFFGGGAEGGELVVLEGAGHLGPLERPGLLAERIVAFCAELGLPVRRQVLPGERFAALLRSGQTSPQTRAAMGSRLLEDDAAYEPQAVGRQGMRVLRELARAVVPGAPFDLAARVDQRLAKGRGDGWRPDALPEDCAAWRRGLASLDAAARRVYGVSFVGLHDELQHALLQEAAAGTLGSGIGERLLQAVGLTMQHGEEDSYSAAEMKQWFAEARGDLGRLYMADPRTMERVGFTGFADEQGFTQIRLAETEAWES